LYKYFILIYFNGTTLSPLRTLNKLRKYLS
jgi:hypothetical protein